MTLIFMLQLIFIAIYILLAVCSDRYPHTLSFVRRNFNLISSIFVILMFICCGGYILC